MTKGGDHGEEGKDEKDAKEGEKAGEHPKAPPALVSLDPFLVNLTDTDGDRFMKCTVRLAIQPPAFAERMKTEEIIMARMRDRILTLFASKTYKDLETPMGRETLRYEIQAAVSPLVEDGKVEDVLFAEFVVQ